MVVIVEPKLEARRSVEERHGERVTASPLSDALRKISPAVVKGLAACARSVTTTTRGVGKLVK